MQTVGLQVPYLIDADQSPVTVFTQIRNILPMSLQNKLQHIRDEHDRLQWIVGDLFNEIYSYVKANEVEATRGDVANYLLFNLGMENDRSFSSVMVDAATAGFYPFEARRKYAVLPFSHFRFAARFGADAGDVLKTALEFIDQYGKPPSCRWLERQYQSNLFERDARATDPGSNLTPGAAAALTGSFGEMPEFQYQPPADGPVNDVRYHVQGLRGAVVRLPEPKAKLIAQIVALCEQALEII
jgi:hypothetical protein